jgi:hypothetical protein
VTEARDQARQFLYTAQFSGAWHFASSARFSEMRSASGPTRYVPIACWPPRLRMAAYWRVPTLAFSSDSERAILEERADLYEDIEIDTS